MRRHDALIPLTHDHHHALVQVKRLTKAVKGEEDALEVARGFLEFYDKDTLLHFHEEEEELFPLLLEGGGEPPELLTQALVDHVRIHGLVRKLQAEVDDGAPSPQTLEAIGTLLGAHVSLEEKKLFPLIQETVDDGRLRAVTLAERHRT